MADSLVLPAPTVENANSIHLNKLSKSNCPYHQCVAELIKAVIVERNYQQAVPLAGRIVDYLDLNQQPDSARDLFLSDESAKIFAQHFGIEDVGTFSGFSHYLISDIISSQADNNPLFKTPVLLVDKSSENVCGDIVFLNAYFSLLPSRSNSKPMGFVLPDLLKSDVISWKDGYDFPKSIQKVMNLLALASHYRVNWFVSCHPYGRRDLLGLEGRSAECSAAVLIHQIDQCVREPQFPSGIRDNCVVTGTIEEIKTPFGSSRLGAIDGLQCKAQKADGSDIRILAIPDSNKNDSKMILENLELQPCATLDDVLIWLQESNKIVINICKSIVDEYNGLYTVID